MDSLGVDIKGPQPSRNRDVRLIPIVHDYEAARLTLLPIPDAPIACARPSSEPFHGPTNSLQRL